MYICENPVWVLDVSPRKAEVEKLEDHKQPEHH